MGIDRIPRVIADISQMVMGTVDRAAQIPFKRDWDIDLFHNGPRCQYDFQSREMNFKNMNKWFQMVSPISTNASEAF
jgi:hypothetical protein